MHREPTRDGSFKVWLTEAEYTDEFRAAAPSYEHELIVRFGHEVGLRHSEIARIRPRHLLDTHATYRETPGMPDIVESVFLEVPETKDTTGELPAGESREAFVPTALARQTRLYIDEKDIGADERLFDYSNRTIRNRVKTTAEAAVEATGDDRYGSYSSHDQRRYFATTMLQKKGVSPEVVMRIGGWDSYDALKPYLREPIDEVVIKQCHEAGLV